MAWKNKLKTLCSKWFVTREEQTCMIIPLAYRNHYPYYYDSNEDDIVDKMPIEGNIQSLVIKKGTRYIYDSEGNQYDLAKKSDINYIIGEPADTTQQEI